MFAKKKRIDIYGTLGFPLTKEGVHRVCIGAYCEEEEDTKFYAPYITAERNSDEQH